MSGNTEKATAGRYLLIYAGLVALVAAYTLKLAIERPELEGYRYPTGLGDGELYDTEANPLDPEKPMAILDGVGYFAAAKPDSWRDRYMVKVARDDDDRFFFYRTSTEIGGGGEEEGGDFYIKLASDQYIKVVPDAPEPNPPADG